MKKYICFIIGYFLTANSQAQSLQYADSFLAQAGSIKELAFSPDASYLTICGEGGTFSVWDYSYLIEITAEKTSTNRIYSVIFDNKSEKIIHCTGENSIREYNVKTETSTEINTGHNGIVNAIALSTSGKTIATAADDAKINILNSETFEIEKTLTGHTDAVNVIQFSPDGKKIVSASDDKSFKIWEIQSGKVIFEKSANYNTVTKILFSPDNKHIYFLSDFYTVLIFNAENYTVEHNVQLENESISDIQLTNNGSHLLISGFAGSLAIFDAINAEKISYQYLNEPLNCIAINNTNSLLAGGTSKGIVKLWKLDLPVAKEIFAPVFNWISPEYSGFEIKKSNFELTVEVSNVKNLERIELFLNDTLQISMLATSCYNATNNSYRIQERLKLKSIENRISIKLSNSYNDEIIENTIVYKKKNTRLALVIGNSDYLEGRLKNPVNDARDLTSTLNEMEFDVLYYENISDKIEMEDAIIDFGKKLASYQVGMFYYAGHGIQVDGVNYLIPTQVRLNSPRVVRKYCLDADIVLAEMEGAGCPVNIVVFDACRNNPFERSWTRSVQGNGLAAMTAPDGTFVAYSTAPGSTALDGEGDNGLYTSQLLEYIKTPGLSIEQVFKKVGASVKQKTEKTQTPWFSSSFTGDFYFIEND